MHQCLLNELARDPRVGLEDLAQLALDVCRSRDRLAVVEGDGGDAAVAAVARENSSL